LVGTAILLKPIFLANAGQGSAFFASLNASNAIERSEKRLIRKIYEVDPSVPNVSTP